MNDEALTKVMTRLEAEIGEKRLTALRIEAARRHVSVLTLLGEAVAQYATALTGKKVA